MSWPTPQDYNEAVQNPDINFSDTELRSGTVATTKLGLPMVASGAFASVYRFRCGQRDVAVRCFLRDTPDQQSRYEKISRYVMSDDLPYTVSFEYQKEGIRIHGRWFPILKMDWVEGMPLDVYVRQNVREKSKMQLLENRFKEMLKDLRRGGIAHGDLQHGNIMITTGDELRLVDYDGMFVPELAGSEAHEIGHRNYQHPARARHHFGERLDNFSAWSIYTCLRALTLHPELIDELNGADECLLMRQNDYRYPLRSKAFHALEHKCESEVGALSRRVRGMLQRSLDDIPYLDEELPEPTGLPPVTGDISISVASLNLPDWLRESTPYTDDSLKTEPPSPGQWPSLFDFLTAAGTPLTSFRDRELQSARPARTNGSVVAVYGLDGAVVRYQRDARKDLAVKIFLKPDPARAEAYRRISDWLARDTDEIQALKKYLVPFRYLDAGIKVGNSFYPILIMDWVDGSTLYETIEVDRHWKSNTYLTESSNKFRRLMTFLQEAHVVHGDIEPSNIIVNGDRLVLVDYDNMRPMGESPLAGANRASNPHFTHPLSDLSSDYGDDFSAWALDSCINMISADPSLWNQLGVRPGRLLFQAKDFVDPGKSTTFKLLVNHYNKTVREKAEQLQQMCEGSPVYVPRFTLMPAYDRPDSTNLTVASQSTALTTKEETPFQRALLPLVASGFFLLCGGGNSSCYALSILFFIFSILAWRNK